MPIQGFLESFSLPELFTIIDSGKKSGRLLLHTKPIIDRQQIKGPYYLWFDSGDFLTISNSLSHQGLIKLIDQRSWMSRGILQKLAKLSPAKTPLGTYLQKTGLLKSEEINLLFQLQLKQVYQLFEVDSGWFKFIETNLLDRDVLEEVNNFPWLEMTGKRIRAKELTVYGLRLIKNWQFFAQQFPEPIYGLKKLVEQPDFHLQKDEWQLWYLANGKLSIKKIAQQLDLSIERIQQIAFCLILLGLVEEITVATDDSNLSSQLAPLSFVPKPIVVDIPKVQSSAPEQKIEAKSQAQVSNSFLNNLLNFLQSKF